MAAAPVAGNRLDLLAGGREFFPALESAIEAARLEVFFETYLYRDDAVGRRVARVLAAAARRGVAVHLLVDGFGSRNLSRALRAGLREAGVRLQVYAPYVPWLSLRPRHLRRLHRKLAVVDGCVAFIGGINITESFEVGGTVVPDYDYAVRVEGPLAGEVRAAASRLWRRVARAHVARAALAVAPAPPPCPARGDLAAALVLRDNFVHRNDIERAYLAAIGAARAEVVIANAYFLPGRRFRRTLVEAAARGVRVVLLLQGWADHPLLLYASRALYGNLLAAGVEIYEYEKSLMHAKVAVVDDRWATVGSSNIDVFSLLLAREANVVIEDPRFARELRGSLHRGMEEGAIFVPPMYWQRQPWHRRARVWLAYGAVRLLVGLAGYGGPF